MTRPPLFQRFLTGFLRLFFRLLYHQFAWTYDWVAALVSVGMWKDWVMAIAPDLHGPQILELGHGPGHLQAALLERGICAFGLDASPQMGRLARKRLKRAGRQPLLVNARGQSIPFPKETFQEVVATFPSEYIAELRTLQEIWRVLKPGGKLVISPVAWIEGRRWSQRAAAWLFRTTGQAPDPTGASHLSGWAANLQAPARRAGFSVKIERRALPSSSLLVIHAEKV